MSKFIDSMVGQLTGIKKAVIGKLSPLTAEHDVENFDHYLPTIEEHRFEATWKVLVSCRPYEYGHVFKNVVAELKNAVHGEFRHKLYRLRNAVYEENKKEMLKIIGELFTEIE